MILNVRFSVLSFLKSLGCDTEEMEPENTEEILAESGKNIEKCYYIREKNEFLRLSRSGIRIPAIRIEVF